MDKIFERLGNLFKSFVDDVFDDDSSASKRTFVDQDEQDAWDELNDFLDEDEPSSSSSSGQKHRSHSDSQSTSGGAEESQLKIDFASLEVPFGTPYEKVKKSYKRLLRKHHPDKHANNPEKLKAATEFTKRINRAFMRIKKYYKKI